MKIIIKLLYVIILFINKLLAIFNKKHFKFRIYEKLRNNYHILDYREKKIIFFTPSLTSYRRAENIFNHEPETIEWIKSFRADDNKEIVFWDVGSCVGQFSILACLHHGNIKVCSFEPSTKNLNLLSTNISLNKLEKKIVLCPYPLSDKSHQINHMVEKVNEEGKASNSFETNNVQEKRYKYSTIGYSADFLIKNNILKSPKYLKIDTDGHEKNIINGSINLIKSGNLKEIQVELTDGTNDAEYCINLLNQNKFKLIKKFREKKYENIEKHIKLFNFRFKKIDE